MKKPLRNKTIEARSTLEYLDIIEEEDGIPYDPIDEMKYKSRPKANIYYDEEYYNYLEEKRENRSKYWRDVYQQEFDDQA